MGSGWRVWPCRFFAAVLDVDLGGHDCSAFSAASTEGIAMVDIAQGRPGTLLLPSIWRAFEQCKGPPAPLDNQDHCPTIEFGSMKPITVVR